MSKHLINLVGGISILYSGIGIISFRLSVYCFSSLANMLV